MAPLSGARTLRPFLGAFLIEERISQSHSKRHMTVAATIYFHVFSR